MMAVMDSIRRTSRIELHSILSIKPTHAVSLSLADLSTGSLSDLGQQAASGKGWGIYHH